MSAFRTTISLNAGGVEYEFEVEVEYSVSPAFAGTYYQPPEPANAEIADISIVTDGKKHRADWLTDTMCDNDELLALCMQDAAERHQDAMESRAEARREERMLGDFS